MSKDLIQQTKHKVQLLKHNTVGENFIIKTAPVETTPPETQMTVTKKIQLRRRIQADKQPEYDFYAELKRAEKPLYNYSTDMLLFKQQRKQAILDRLEQGYAIELSVPSAIKPVTRLFEAFSYSSPRLTLKTERITLTLKVESIALSKHPLLSLEEMLVIQIRQSTDDYTIVKFWNELKKVRQAQGFHSTSLSLSFSTSSSIDQEQKQQVKEEIKTMLTENPSLDYKSAKKQVLQRYKQSIKQQIHVQYGHITPTPDPPAQEIDRKRSLEKAEFCIHVFCNGKFVTATPFKSLKEFVVIFDLSIGLCVEALDTIELYFYQRGIVSNTLLGKVFVPRSTFTTNQYQLDFTSEDGYTSGTLHVSTLSRDFPETSSNEESKRITTTGIRKPGKANPFLFQELATDTNNPLHPPPLLESRLILNELSLSLRLDRFTFTETYTPPSPPRTDLSPAELFCLSRSSIPIPKPKHPHTFNFVKVIQLPEAAPNQWDWLKENRPLRPTRRLQPVAREADVGGVFCQIVSASYLPVSSKTKAVRPFATTSFKGIEAKTNVKEGNNPMWNATLNLNLNVPFKASVMHSLHDEIVVSVWDEFAVDLILDDRSVKVEAKRKEKVWLGSLRIPLSTLYETKQLDGMFKIEGATPLGYERITEKDVWHSGMQDSLIRVFMSLDPPLYVAKPLPTNFKVVDALEKSLLQKISDWSIPPNWALDRKYSSFVLNTNGNLQLACRFLTPLDLPPFVSQNRVEAVRQLVEYVGSIATMKDARVGEYMVWSSLRDIFKVKVASPVDHAVILASFLANLSVKAYVVLGSGMPFGDVSAWTLLWNEEKSEWRIIDYQGKGYYLHDRLPIIRIDTLMNAKNVWANVQKQTDPSHSTFDLTDKHAWRPLLNAAQIPSAWPQPNIDYALPTEESLRLLKKQIEREIQRSVEDWRHRFPTRWNRICCQHFSQFLESNAPLDAGSMPGYQLTGWPLKFPYLSIDTIVQGVRDTGVHDNDDPRVEFGLAVKCSGIHGGFQVVCVFIGTMLRNK